MAFDYTLVTNLQHPPLVMGILNVTPDSFSDGGQFNTLEAALTQAQNMIQAGADILDIGGESTKPGSEPVDPETEIARVLPVIRAIRETSSIPISIDTYHPQTAQAALESGADILNDITGMTNTDMRQIAHHFQAPVIILHMQGVPKTMQVNPQYTDVIQDIIQFLKAQIDICTNAGIHDIILDPGFGFGKRLEDNFIILKEFERFTRLNYPCLCGLSRKGFLGTLTGTKAPIEREHATTAAHVLALLQGARILRTHNVAAAKQAVQTVWAIRQE